MKKRKETVKAPCTIEFVFQEKYEGEDAYWALYIDDDHYDGISLPDENACDTVIKLVKKHGKSNFYSYMPDEWRL